MSGDKLDNSLDNYGGNASAQTGDVGYGGLSSSNTFGSGDYSSGGGQTVSGAYEGGSTGDALTGQSELHLFSYML